MPMGTIVRLLSNHSNSSPTQVIGSFTNIYNSIVNLEAKYFATKACQDVLLKTRNMAEAECRKLKINIDNTNWMHVSIVRGQEEVFVSKTASFVITNDLHVIPNIPASTFAILYSYDSGFTDFGLFEERTFNIGYSEILDLLKYSFMFETPLTALFLGKIYNNRDKSFKTINCAVSMDRIVNFKKMTVKVLVQKSSNKLLLAYSSKDFIDFLFNLCTVPLRRVIGILHEYYFPALCVDNIYQSVLDLNVGEYFKSEEMKDMLLCPQLAIFHQCFNRLLPPEKEKNYQKFYLNKEYTPPGKGYYNVPYLTTDSASANHVLKSPHAYFHPCPCPDNLNGSDPLVHVSIEYPEQPRVCMLFIKECTYKQLVEFATSTLHMESYAF